MKSHTLIRTERPKTIPCLAAHPRIGHIREYPSPQALSSELLAPAASLFTRSTNTEGLLAVYIMSYKTISGICRDWYQKSIVAFHPEFELAVLRYQ